MFMFGKDLFMYRLNKAKDFILKSALAFTAVFILIAMFVVFG